MGFNWGDPDGGSPGKQTSVEQARKKKIRRKPESGRGKEKWRKIYIKRGKIKIKIKQNRRRKQIHKRQQHEVKGNVYLTLVRLC